MKKGLGLKNALGFLSALLLILAMTTSCATKSVSEDEVLDDSSPDVQADSSDFEFDEGESLADTEENAQKEDAQVENKSQESTDELGDELVLEEEKKEEPQKEQIQAQQEPKPQQEPQQETAVIEPILEEKPPKLLEQEPPVAITPMESNEVLSMKIVPNDTGGALVIETKTPSTYTSRMNAQSGQFVIDIQGARLPEKLKRPLIAKDIQGIFGSIDSYQSPGTDTAHIVVQLKAGAQSPTVQAEGATLVVAVTSGNAMTAQGGQSLEGKNQGEGSSKGSFGVATVAEFSSSEPLSSSSLNEFLASNNQFYGKPISIETNDMDVREALRFITEESGLNMIVEDGVSGKISLKLREVPWDQALVLLMKSKKLGYSRQGNVLRVAPLASLKQEEEEANRLAMAKKTVEPLKVRMYQLSYAKIDEMQKSVKEFLSERGKVIGDLRTNSLVVTDIEDHLARVAKLIENLDTMPLQVLIEGKVVEATERFSRDIGINWSSSGDLIKLGSNLNMQPSFSISPEAKTSGAFTGSVNVGLLDLLGTISATLALNEKENRVKVISSPRILTLSNEKANIVQISQEPSKTVTVSQGAPVVSYSFIDLPLKLEVTPQVTSDSSIIMKILVERAFRGDTVGTGDNERFSVNKRTVDTKVLVKNGQTAVIGGIYKSDASNGETGVPYLRKIPFLGALFRSEIETKDKSELIIFLTPRIVGEAVAQQKALANGEASSVLN